MKRIAVFVAAVGVLVLGAAGIQPRSALTGADPSARRAPGPASTILAERAERLAEAPLVLPEPAAEPTEPTEPVLAATAGAIIDDAAASGLVDGAVLETLRGTASYYADYFAGQLTASGEPYNPRELVAAHRTLPFGTVVRVTNEANGRTVTVRIIDRGPFAGGDRIIDLSRRAAERLEFIHGGLAPVTVEVLEYGD